MMQQFKNILYVSNSANIELDTLKEAHALCEKNAATLNIILTHPIFPEKLQDVQTSYAQTLRQNLENALKSVSATALNNINIEIQSTDTPAAEWIRHVIKDTHDLVIKEAAIHRSGKGYQSVDLELLRKCPCPVWLYRKSKHQSGKMRIAVAIDPQSHSDDGNDLAIKLLKMAESMTVHFQGELSILSCWDFEFENYLHNNVFVHVSDEEIQHIVKNAQASHRSDLDGLVHQAQLRQTPYVIHLRGKPEHIIPSYIDDNKIDLLLMGTVARSGIPGLVIGNTAENILHKVNCSLLTMKPNGFVSPIKI